jgi:hypothetical protein
MMQMNSTNKHTTPNSGAPTELITGVLICRVFLILLLAIPTDGDTIAAWNASRLLQYLSCRVFLIRLLAVSIDGDTIAAWNASLLFSLFVFCHIVGLSLCSQDD